MSRYWHETDMQLSVVIVSYNTKELTLKCIDSVLANSSGLDIEIVVIDNNSTDGSVQGLRKLRVDKIKTVENSENLGFAKAVNQGIKLSSGEHILLLNSDCKLTQAALKMVGLLDERYFMYFEDLDFCKRVWKAGLKVYYLPSAEVIHYHGASGRDIADSANQWRRLIPSSKIYHGVLKHYLIFA